METKNYVSYKDKFNKKYGYTKGKSHTLAQVSKDTGVSLKGLQQIYNKGIGAYKTNPQSVRPNVKSKEQWAMARVYSAVMGGKASKIDSAELKMAKGGLVAPNGLKSNLTPLQYKLVRTPAFKAWFGDWENDPANASKVVDENGEPLVVFHGTDKKFNVFKKINQKFDNENYVSGMWFFSPPIGQSLTPQDREYFYDEGSAEYMAESWTENGFVLKCFLKVINPIEVDDYDRFLSEVRFGYMDEAIKNGQTDGYIIHGSLTDGNVYRDDINVFEPNQIKLADGTNTTFDGNNPDIRFEQGGVVELYQSNPDIRFNNGAELYSEISKEINEVDAFSNQDLTPMQIQYLNKKLLFFLSDKMNTLREIDINLWKELRQKQRNVKDILNIKDTNKGVAGYLNEKYAYHFTTIFNLIDIVEERSIGNWQELGDVISLTTNPLFGEVEVSGVKSWNEGMDIEKATFFSDLSVKIVFDLQKIKADGIKIRKGSGKTGTHFGEYELIIPTFSEEDKWWKYVSWIEIDKNKKEINTMLNYEWVKEMNIKDVMQLPINIWINNKEKQSTLGLELKKLGIEVREREKIDVEKYLFGNKKPKYSDGGLIAPNGKPSNLTPLQYKLVRTPAFKAWFGDWENDPKNASKVIDENGEPLVVYHADKKEWWLESKKIIFDAKKEGKNTNVYRRDCGGIYFTSNKRSALEFGNYVNSFFLNFRKPIFEDAQGYKVSNSMFLDTGCRDMVITNTWDLVESYRKNEDWMDVSIFVTSYSNRIKLADGTNKTFDGRNPDIRFDDGGKVNENFKSEKIKLSVLNKIKKLSKRILEIQKYNLGYEDDIYSYKGDLSFKERRKLFEEERKLNNELTEVTDNLSQEQCFSINDENFQALNSAGDYGYEDENYFGKGGMSLNTQTGENWYAKGGTERKYKLGGNVGQEITCQNCGWHWNTKDSANFDKYVCHRCDFDNSAFYSKAGLKKEKTGKVPREFRDDFTSEVEDKDWVETNLLSVHLTPIDKK
jgi:hypothetical protein